jgi:hypothetical protein
VIGTEPLGHVRSLWDCFNTDDHRGTHEARAKGRAKSYWSLGENGNRITNPYSARLCPSEASRHNIGTHQHLFVRQGVRYRGKVGHSIGDQDILSLTSVNRVAELPPTDRLPTVGSADAVLRVKTRK